MILDKLQRLVDKVNFRTFLEVWSKVMMDNRQVIEDAQRYQLGRGELPDGSDTDGYSPISIEFFYKPSTENPYLEDSSSDNIVGYDTGSLYRDIYADINPFGVTHEANNPNKEKLEARIGKFLGINKKTAGLIVEQLRKEYLQMLRSEILR